MHKDFLDFLNNNKQKIFIDVEATEIKMNEFIKKYNQIYSTSITITDDGICLLGNVDKWGVELRIYFNDLSGLPNEWDKRKYRNRNYRSGEFNYRLDDNKLIWYLFDNGYQIGYN